MKLVAAVFVALAVLAAGCGGEDGGDAQLRAEAGLPREVADELAQRSDRVAERLDANDPCEALSEAEALQAQAIVAVNDGRVPPRYQEELTSAVNALASSIECTPPVEPLPPTVAETLEEEDDEAEEGDDNGKGHGKGKGKGKGGDDD